MIENVYHRKRLSSLMVIAILLLGIISLNYWLCGGDDGGDSNDSRKTCGRLGVFLICLANWRHFLMFYLGEARLKLTGTTEGK